MTENAIDFIDLGDKTDANDIIETCYKAFKETTFKISERPLLNSKVVSVPIGEWIDGRSSTFWHMASLKISEKFTVLPCQNTNLAALCNQNCITCEQQVTVKGQLRNVCFYRAAQVHLMNKVLKDLNAGASHVKMWEKKELSSGRNNTYVRYQNGSMDYLLLFTDRKQKYELITGYPIFYIRSKDGFESDYKRYLQSKNR